MCPTSPYDDAGVAINATFDPDELDPMKKPFWSPSEVRRLGFGHQAWVLRAIREGEIEHIRIGRKFLIPTTWIRRQMGLPDLG